MDTFSTQTLPTRQGQSSGQGGLSFSWSPGFPKWLQSRKTSLAFTACRTNRLFLLGSKPDGRLSLVERRFERPLGLQVDDEGRLFMATRDRIWRLDNALGPDERHGHYDRLYVPRRSWTTGFLNTHDLALDADGNLLFVNTLFSCISRLSRIHSFEPVWKPPFISALLPEDRCHLNGLAMDRGTPRYVTLRNQSDTARGWRRTPAKGGCLMDVLTGRAILTDLSVPHSPRIHKSTLWLLNSGTGELGVADLKQRRFIPVCAFPGYLRGLAFFGTTAVVGVSKARDGYDFEGLPLAESLKEHGTEPICGLCFVDITTGKPLHVLRFHGAVSELYDVQVLPGVSSPTVLGFQSDEIQNRVIIDPDAASMLRKESA